MTSSPFPRVVQPFHFKDTGLISPLLPFQNCQLHPDQHHEDDSPLATFFPQLARCNEHHEQRTIQQTDDTAQTTVDFTSKAILLCLQTASKQLHSDQQ